MFKFLLRRAAGRSVAFCALLLLAVGCDSGPHQVEAHGGAGRHAPDPVAVTVFTSKVELFMEYPRLVPGLKARFLAHVTVLATGEPVRSGQLRLELHDATGKSLVFEALRPKRDGLFIPVGALEAAGQYEAKIVVESEQVQETIQLSPIVVHADMSSAHAAADREAVEDPSEAVPFLLEQQWKIGLLMEQVELRSLTTRLQVLGEAEAPQGALAVVSSPVTGRLVPPVAGRLPRIGDSVHEGQVLGFLEPSLTTSDVAQLAANEMSRAALEMELLVREFDVRTKELELNRTLRQADVRLEFARRTLARIEALRAKGLGTVGELELARRDVELALRIGEDSRELAESFAEKRVRVEDLRARGASLRGEAGTAKLQRFPLVAPVSGEIVEAGRVEGETIESLSEVFRVLDSSRIWIAAHVSEFDFSRVGDLPGALLTFSAYPDWSIDVLETEGGRVVNVGRVVDPETRTIPLRYEISNPERRIRVGMFADVFIAAEKAAAVVAVDKESIVMDNGRPVAFVLVHGEMFQKRILELGIRDGDLVEVRSGIGAGDRVVTRGAYLVNLASASPASFGAGHAH